MRPVGKRYRLSRDFDLRGLRFVLLGTVFMAAALLPALGNDPDNCLFCHQYRGLSVFNRSNDTTHVFFIEPEYVHQQLGPHAMIACTDCHERSEVSVVPHTTVSKVDCTRNCHLGKPGGLEERFSHRNVAEMLERSVHTPELLAKVAPSKGRLLSEGQSKCLYCHDEPVFRDPTGTMPVLKELGSRTFDRCDVCHKQQVQEDTAYYLRHIAARLQSARPSLEMESGPSKSSA